MKKKYWLLVTVFTCVILYWIFLRRTPESIVKAFFDINMSEFKYSVDYFDEQWYPNGNGHVYIVFKLKELTPDNIIYLKSKKVSPLPISRDLGSVVSQQFMKMKKGYYIFSFVSNYDKRDFDLFIINTETNEIILYCQDM